MIYVCLLRGINVGGKNKVEMARLKSLFEQIGFAGVKTYINSGNIIFESNKSDTSKLVTQIEAAIVREFGFAVNVLVRSFAEVEKLVRVIPPSWVNDSRMKCDVMFLWDKIDSPKILEQLPINSAIEDIKYFPGTVVWRVDRSNQAKSRLVKIIGTDLYKQLTIRNINTVRKLYDMMQS